MLSRSYILERQRLSSKPIISPRPSRQLVIHRSFDPYSLQTLEFSSYLFGKSIITFTMLYCGLNYFYYRTMYEEEKEDTEDTEK
jgi:hypothetical protein